MPTRKLAVKSRANRGTDGQRANATPGQKLAPCLTASLLACGGNARLSAPERAPRGGVPPAWSWLSPDSAPHSLEDSPSPTLAAVAARGHT